MNKITLALCMIVKNEEEILSKTLPQFKKLFNEIHIVDTGSDDKTIDIIRSFDIEPKHFQWQNDFSAARNFSIKDAKSDWIIWLDADEFMKEEDLSKLKEHISSNGAECYCIKALECKEGEFNPYGYLRRNKVFKNNAGLHFEREINEDIFNKNGVNVQAQKIDVNIYHWGGALALQESKERKEKKEKRNIKLYKSLVEKNPNDFRANMLLGKNHLIAQNLDLAYGYFVRAVSLTVDKEEMETNLVDASFCAVHLDKIEEAKDIAKKALEINDKNVGARCNLSLVYIKEKNKEEAVKILEEVIDEPYPENKIYSINKSYYSFQRYLYLAQAYLMQGQKEKAMAILQKGLEEYKDEKLKNLIDVYKIKAGVL